MRKIGIVTSLYRSQVSSIIATVVDFGTLIVLVELFGVWYVLATAFGALAGAVTNFLMGRHWSFEARDGHVYGQAFRYFLVSFASLILNSSGVYFFTDYVELKYIYSKIIVALLVGLLFNFPLHRGFVFR